MVVERVVVGRGDAQFALEGVPDFGSVEHFDGTVGDLGSGPSRQ